jgi:signal transduction histidine kinase
MTPRGEWPTLKWPKPGWFRPPASLFLILFLLTLVSISALSWFGWRLFEQERLVDAQRSREHLEQAADRIAATIRSTLAETGDRLGEWDRSASDSLGPVLRIQEDTLTLAPPARLLYWPLRSPYPEAPETHFAEAEQMEFAQRSPQKALAIYAKLMASEDAPTRAGALLRAARAQRNLGQAAQSRALYRRLAEMQNVNVAGAPAELVAKLALCEPTEACPAVAEGLREGRWQLTQPQFEFYSAEAHAGAPAAEAVELAQAAARAWDERNRNQNARGQETIWIGDHAYFLLWRGTPDRRALLIARPEAILKQVAATQGTRYALTDNDGRVLAGEKDASVAHGAVRTAADSQLPWTLFVTATQPLSTAGLIAQQRFLLLSVGVMVLFLVAATYFIARAIRRESETMRMQSDFVSAVSHEFRTPLTSVRQLSELLAHGRVPTEERRSLYYRTLLRESARLERLVEGLLNFGRMEAGGRQYHFEELDASSLVHRVVAEFAPQLEAQGRHIEISGAPTPLKIDADPEAIGVALRNLVDNAIKYSPGRPTVWIDFGPFQHYVAIRVRDQGPGIPDSERRRIFRRFVRGSAALSTNAKGSGVGLAMVRHIVAAHGGEITVSSQAGQGSVFTMLLPEVKAA